MNWDLIGWSFTVIRRNIQLALFPLISAVAAIAAMWLCFGWRFGSLRLIVERPRFSLEDYLWLAPALLAVSFILIFFNCALAASANAALSGKPADLSEGLRHASARILPILVWALLSTTVGLVLRSIERRLSFLGKLTTWIFGFAWTTTTYFVVPVLIAEDRGSLASVRRSAEIARKMWGNQIVAEIRWGWRGLAFFVPCLILFTIGLNGYGFILPIAVAFSVVAAAALSAAHGVFEVALYRHATLGETPNDWTPAIVNRIVR